LKRILDEKTRRASKGVKDHEGREEEKEKVRKV
jgi:hypothetical protein